MCYLNFYFFNITNINFFTIIKNNISLIKIDFFFIKNKCIYFLNNWVYTTNHKKIAVNYFWFVIFAGIVGLVLATLIRLEMAYPGIGIFSGDSLQYLSVVTAHGVIMVFFMVMPLLFGAFGNFLLPSQLGVHDVAFPRLNSAAFWFLPAGLIMLCQLVCIDKKYQRINCFNISEIQIMLKNVFFKDLIFNKQIFNKNNNSKLLLKYKTLDMNYNSNEILSNNLLNNFLSLNNIFNLSFNKKTFFYLLNNPFPNLINFYLLIYNNIKLMFNLLTFNFNFNFFFLFFEFNQFYIKISLINPLIKVDYWNKFIFNNTSNLYYFNSNKFFFYSLFYNSINLRFFSNYFIKFKYNYKYGNYLPNNLSTLFPFLMPSLINLNINKRTNSWFLSPLFNDLKKNLFLNSKNNFFLKNSNTFNITNIFYLFLLNNYQDQINFKWIQFNSLNQKFYKFFLSSSLQQRIYSNWRILKFSREAWRTRLLIIKNQKTSYLRYSSENNVFWLIERNAKDLLPGWAMITPFSTRLRYTTIGKTDIGLFGVFLTLNASIISSANFLLTYRYLSTLNNRKMRDARSFFTEGIMVTSLMMIAANPMLIIGILMLLSDRHLQTSFFDYSGGGDTVLFQHMFWFFGHPEVYVIMIPVFGFTNTILSAFLKKRISARTSLIYSLYTIAFLGFFVWGHHMYMVGLAHTTRMLFSTLTVMISVPAATKLMHWCITIINSTFYVELPLLFIFVFIFLFISGGISGMCVAHTGMDVLFHDTLYVIGHFHIMFAGAVMFGSFGAFFFYFNAIFGIKYNKYFVFFHFFYYLIGHLITFIPFFWLGYSGMPRRVLDYPYVFGGWHSIASSGHILAIFGLIFFIIAIIDSLRNSKLYLLNLFGIGRYNIRLNFYLYEILRLSYFNKKTITLINNYTLKKTIKNYELYETTLFSYSFYKYKY